MSIEIDTNYDILCQDWSDIMNLDLEIVQSGKYFNVLNKWEIDKEVERLLFYDGYSKRVVILRKNPTSNYFIKSLTEVHHDGKPHVKGKDRGHLIAHSFKYFLLTADELNKFGKKVDIFFGKKNKANITPQSPTSNRNSKEFTDQSNFELQIYDYLKNQLMVRCILKLKN